MTRAYMPILEWVCVAAIPLYLCNKIVRRRIRRDDDDNFLQYTLILMSMTALLSLFSIFIFTNSNKQKKQLRDEGSVIGSHLIPVMYFSLYLLDCQQNDDSNQSRSFGLQHVIYSTYGGLAFILSCVWLRRKGDKNAPSKNNAAVMQLCWKVYLLFIFSHQLFYIAQYGQNYLPCTVLGALHSFMILCHGIAVVNNQCKHQRQWQDAFTCGEWMVVSNLTASLIGDFILHYSSSTYYNLHSDLLEHTRVAQAGLVGCIAGVLFSQSSSQGITGTVAGVVGIMMGFLEMILSRSLTSARGWMSLVPRSLQWLHQFLSSEVGVGDNVNGFKRYVILGYWSLVIIVSFPLTIKLCNWIARDDILRKRRIVIARKFFHLVAIILFAPITWVDPDLMALSYAVATALLMILEIIRCHSFVKDQHKAPSSLNAFYDIFLDEKDSLAGDGGLAITHIALIVGCAMPLWVSQIVNFNENNSIIEYVGVIVLGIGDSAGAIAGILFGRHPWPGGSRRTSEGSFCMFVSMLVPLYLIGVDNLNKIGPILAIVTILEASTSQIDNLCLPLAGISLVALLAAGDASSSLL